MYPYLKALHVIFVVTWFAGLFYMPRIIIYIIEANEKTEAERKILHNQLELMLGRLWYGITWPSAIITLVLGVWALIDGNWWLSVMDGGWMLWKSLLVILLYGYHISLQYLYNKTMAKKYPYSGQAIRYWNEVPTVLLFAIVILVVVKTNSSLYWAMGIGFGLIAVLMIAIKIYKQVRAK